MKKQIVEDVRPIAVGDLDDHAQQLTLLLIYALDKLGGMVKLPPFEDLHQWAEGRHLVLTRNTDGTAQLITHKKDGPDA